jgi:hypothetical protein
MGKVAKKKVAEKRKEQKRARKRTNYLRFGPKENHSGKRQKRKKYGTFKPRPSDINEPVRISYPGIKARKRLRLGTLRKKRKVGRAKLPLRPLRKRRHLGSDRRQSGFIGG